MMKSKIIYTLLICLIQFFGMSCARKTTIVQNDSLPDTPGNQFPAGSIWKDTDTSFTRYTCPGKVFPTSYRMLDVDTALTRKLLVVQGKQPGEISTDTLLLDIPMPDGTNEPFRLYQVQVMAPELAAKYPYLKTYAGTGKLYPADQIRLETGPDGLRAMILSSRGTILLDPFCKDDKLHMISYFRKNLPPGVKDEFERK